MSHQPRRRFGIAFRARAGSRSRRTVPFTALALAALTIATFGSFSAWALAEPPVYVHGAITDIDAVVRGNQMFVAVLGVFEKLNTAIIYTPPSGVVARKANTELTRLTLGSRISTIRRAPHVLSNASFTSAGCCSTRCRAPGPSVVGLAAHRTHRLGAALCSAITSS